MLESATAHAYDCAEHLDGSSRKQVLAVGQATNAWLIGRHRGTARLPHWLSWVSEIAFRIENKKGDLSRSPFVIARTACSAPAARRARRSPPMAHSG
ncbi:hypothetical protein [Pseudomonas sp. 1152_12]|uniref:hypothetical protein n=1 Tax=Pseudomonas sp. 1152_12 TaxID=2604455 RepID=UPI004062D22F